MDGFTGTLQAAAEEPAYGYDGDGNELTFAVENLIVQRTLQVP